MPLTHIITRSHLYTQALGDQRVVVSQHLGDTLLKSAEIGVVVANVKRLCDTQIPEKTCKYVRLSVLIRSNMGWGESGTDQN